MNGLALVGLVGLVGRVAAGLLAVMVPVILGSCATAPEAAPPAPGAPPSGAAMVQDAAMATAGARGATAESSRAGQPLSDPTPRPGLGTGWGEAVRSPMTYTSFLRAGTRPHQGVATIWYNDQDGIDAMTGRAYSTGGGRQRAAGGLVEWGVKSGFGYLKNYYWDSKRFVAGRKGGSYTIVIRSHARSRLEAVVSVDGLDVLDGQPASVKKRGYILWPGQTLEIKGWRTSEREVAAFRFSSVSGSYSNLKHGATRNVGVIGLAVFTEKGIDPWRGFSREGGPGPAPFAEAPVSQAR